MRPVVARTEELVLRGSAPMPAHGRGVGPFGHHICQIRILRDYPCGQGSWSTGGEGKIPREDVKCQLCALSVVLYVWV